MLTKTRKAKNKGRMQISRPRRNGGLRPKDEAFCRAIAREGMSQARAYRTHIATPQATRATIDQQASRLVRIPQIAARLEELRTDFDTFLVEELEFGKRDAARYLVGAVRTPIGDITESSEFCQEKTEATVSNGEEQSTTITKIKSVSKLDAMEKLAKMAGWYPSTGGNGASGNVPQVVINLGAMFSPALGDAEALRVTGAKQLVRLA